MKNWKVELTAGGKSLVEVNIMRDVFKRDVLSPLLFVIVMVPLSYMFKKDTGGYKILLNRKRLTT